MAEMNECAGCGTCSLVCLAIYTHTYVHVQQWREAELASKAREDTHISGIGAR
jgi:Fe-S-cluster-containing hydrogenase component 2